MLAHPSIACAYCLPIATADNRSMETREEIAERIRDTRRRRLREFIQTFKDRGETQAAAAEKLGIAPEFISQLKMNDHRGIGEPLARYMELCAGLPMLWFDELVVDSHVTPRERLLLEHFRMAPSDIQLATETILERHTARPDDPQADIDTVVMAAAKKAG